MPNTFFTVSFGSECILNLSKRAFGSYSPPKCVHGWLRSEESILLVRKDDGCSPRPRCLVSMPNTFFTVSFGSECILNLSKRAFGSYSPPKCVHGWLRSEE